MHRANSAFTQMELGDGLLLDQRTLLGHLPPATGGVKHRREDQALDYVGFSGSCCMAPLLVNVLSISKESQFRCSSRGRDPDP